MYPRVGIDREGNLRARTHRGAAGVAFLRISGLLLLLCTGVQCERGLPLPDDLPPLTGLRAAPEISAALSTSERALRKGEFARAWARLAPADTLALHRIGWVKDSADHPASRAAAGDSLFAWWRADPCNLSWINLALQRSSLFRRTDRLNKMLALPILADTSSIAGRFVYACLSNNKSERCFHYARAWQDGQVLPLPQKLLLLEKASFCLRKEGRNEEAVDLLLSGLAEFRRSGESGFEARAWMRLARSLRHLDRSDEALLALSHAVLLADASAWFYEASNERVQLALLYSERGETANALSLLRSNRERTLAQSLHRENMITLNHLSALYIELGEYAAALACDLSSVEMALGGADSTGVVRCYLNVADDNVQLGRLDEAWRAIQTAKTWAKRLNDANELWPVYTEESDYWLLRGEYHKADSLAECARIVGGEHRQDIGEALRLYRVARLARETGDVDNAFSILARLETLLDATLISTTGVDLCFMTSIELASLYTETGEFDLARKRLNEAEARLGSPPAAGNAILLAQGYGYLLREAGDQPGALASFRQALSLAETRGLPHILARQRLQLASQLLMLDRPGEAAAIVAKVDRHLDENSSYLSRQLKHLLTGRIALAEGQPDHAIAVLKQSLAESGQALPPELAVSFHTELARALRLSGDLPGALGHFAAAAELLDLARPEVSSLETSLVLGDAIRDCFEGWIDLLLSREKGSIGAEPAAESLSLYLRMLALERGLGRVPDLAAIPRPALIILPLDSKSVTWVCLEDDIHCLHGAERKHLSELCISLRHRLGSADRDWRPEIAAELAELLLSPLRKDWRENETLHILATGPLRGLPWSALPWKNGLVLDHAPIVNWCPQTHGPAPGGGEILAVGYNGHETPLRFAELEARQIAALYSESGRLLLGREASELEAWLGSRAWRGIHLSMHARMIQGLAGRSWLSIPAAAGGDTLLSSWRIRELEIESGLVFLSCCESSSGTLSRRGHAPDLTGAFLEAGAAAVIASSLRVSDEASVEFSLSFHRHWIKGLNPAEALRRACLELRDEFPGRAHPHFWSTWQLYSP